jgi:hypothetical protein
VVGPGEGKGAFRLGGGRRGRLRGRVWRRLGLRPTGSLRHWRVHPQCLLGVDDPPHTCSCSVFLLLPSYPLFPAFLIPVFESRFCYVLLPFSHVILFTTFLWDEVDWFLHSRSYLSSFTRFALTLPLYLSVLNDHHFPAQMYSYSVYQLLRNIILGCCSSDASIEFRAEVSQPLEPDGMASVFCVRSLLPSLHCLPLYTSCIIVSLVVSIYLSVCIYLDLVLEH